MAHYAPSIFYLIIGATHGKIIHHAAKVIRQPVFFINGAIASFPVSDFPSNAQVALLDDREHVLTISMSSPTAQFSKNYQDIAVECAISGWLEVKR